MSDPNNSSEDVALSLTLAVVTASPAPLLLLDGQLVVLAVSTSFCEAFGAASADVIGLPLYALDDGEWDSPQVRSLIAATVAGELAPAARDVDFRRPARPVRDLIVQARRLVYLDLEQTRILIAVTDVTDALAEAALKDDAIREGSVLRRRLRRSSSLCE
jgi:PAS domain-containing protein